MRGAKSTIALVVLLAGLGAYFYFVTSKLPEGGETAKKQEKVFAGLDATKIEEIKVTSAAGDATTLKKDGGGWQVIQPIAAKGDESEATSITSALAAAEISRVIDENPSNLKEYGLDKPEATVNLNAGSARAMLLIGAKAPDGTTVYARDAARPAVVTIESTLLDELKKGADDYRRKDLFEFRPFNAAHIELSRNGQTVVLDRVKGQNDK